MPVSVAKVDGYKVKHNGRVSAKKTSYTKAMLQKRLLNAVRHGWKPAGKKAQKKVARPRR